MSCKVKLKMERKTVEEKGFTSGYIKVEASIPDRDIPSQLIYFPFTIFDEAEVSALAERLYEELKKRLSVYNLELGRGALYVIKWGLKSPSEKQKNKCSKN